MQLNGDSEQHKEWVNLTLTTDNKGKDECFDKLALMRSITSAVKNMFSQQHHIPNTNSLFEKTQHNLLRMSSHRFMLDT